MHRGRALFSRRDGRNKLIRRAHAAARARGPAVLYTRRSEDRTQCTCAAAAAAARAYMIQPPISAVRACTFGPHAWMHDLACIAAVCAASAAVGATVLSSLGC